MVVVIRKEGGVEMDRLIFPKRKWTRLLPIRQFARQLKSTRIRKDARFSSDFHPPACQPNST